jgi:sirohydrochlorin ferrochelatase
MNIGNAIGVDRVIFGYVGWQDSKAHPLTTSIGLTRQDIAASVFVVDLLSEKTLAKAKSKASGFGPGPAAARESAIRLMLSDLVKRLPQLSRTAPASLRRIRVQIDGVSPAALDRYVAALKKLRATQSVALAELELRAAVLSITPATAKDAVERYLKKAEVTYTFVP